MRLVPEIEMRVDAQAERLEAPAARQLQNGLDVARQAELLLVPARSRGPCARVEDVERERHGIDDREVRLPGQLLRTVDPLEALLRRPDRIEVQREHEPPNIPRRNAPLSAPPDPGPTVFRM